MSVDSGIGSRSLPGQELRQRQGKASQGTGKYTVRAGDILAAPESTVPGISGLNEKEILIDKEMAFTCGSGITACILGLANSIISGKKPIIYDGSWAEYGL